MQIPKKAGGGWGPGKLSERFAFISPDVLFAKTQRSRRPWTTEHVARSICKWPTSLPRGDFTPQRQNFLGVWDDWLSPPRLKFPEDSAGCASWMFTSDFRRLLLRTGPPRERCLPPSHEDKAPNVQASQGQHDQGLHSTLTPPLPGSPHRKPQCFCLQSLFFRKHEDVHFKCESKVRKTSETMQSIWHPLLIAYSSGSQPS